MPNTISFTPTILKGLATKVNLPKWTESMELFDKKEYKNSLYAMLDYWDGNILKNYANPEKSEIVLPQGSAVLMLIIDDQNLTMRAPFVSLPDDKQLPVLRKCIEINHSVMTLSQIELKDNLLSISCTIPLELCEPWKVYEAMRDIAVNADKYDDEFVSKFGAKRIMEPRITPYSPEVLQTIRTTIQKIASEALDQAAYFDSKRIPTSTWKTLSAAMNRIRYYAEPTGMISNKFSDAEEAMRNGDNDVNTQNRAGRQVIEALKAITPEECADSFYMTYEVISRRNRADRKMLQDWIGPENLEGCKSLYAGRDYENVVVYAHHVLYLFLAQYNIEEPVQRAIEYSLKKAAGQPWKECAEALLKVIVFLGENKAEKMEMDDEPKAVAPAAKKGEMPDLTAHLEGAKDVKAVLGNLMKSFGF